jgi:Flp pilus assembly protein TadD
VATLGNQGKFEETLTAFDKAIRIDPKSADAWHSKGIALEMLNRYSEANITYAKSKELDYNGTK